MSLTFLCQKFTKTFSCKVILVLHSKIELQSVIINYFAKVNKIIVSYRTAEMSHFEQTTCVALISND